MCLLLILTTVHTKCFMTHTAKFSGPKRAIQNHAKFVSSFLAENEESPNNHDCPLLSIHSTSNLITISRDPCFLGSVNTTVTAEESSSVLLRCLVYNVNFSTVVITWWREGQMQELTLGLEIHNPRYKLPRLSYEDWSLQILSAKPEDSGTYICQINLEYTLEKTFTLHVRARPNLRIHSRLIEHEFVKDEAVNQNSLTRIRIEGQNEGFAGHQLILSCVAQFKAYSAQNLLVWSYGTGFQRTFLVPSSLGKTLALLMQKINAVHIDTDHFSGGSVSMNTNISQNVHISNAQGTNGTFLSVLTLKPLRVEHAGVWWCSKFQYPQEQILEEARTMVYVRTKNKTQRGSMSQFNAGKNAKRLNNIAFSFVYSLLLTLSCFLTITIMLCVL